MGSQEIREVNVTGLHFERRGEGYYRIILHIGSCYVPVSDEIVEDLKKQVTLSPDQFLDVFIEKVGYSSYLKDQIRQELTNGGDAATQASTLQQAICEF